MEAADLAHWTPIAVDFSGPQPTIDWCDLSDVRFDDPFFDQTVQRCRDGRAMVRTDLDALVALDGFPSLAPAGFIFHLSRSGSTLVTRLLQTMPANLVVVEPAPLNAVLRLAPEQVDEAVRVKVLHLLIRALARGRTETHYVVKFSSWNVCRAAQLTAAFPDVPKIWLQRSPVEVAASLLARPPGWLTDLRAMQSIFALDAAQAAANAPERVAYALDAMLDAAASLGPDRTFDYRDLPDAVWREVAPLFGIGVSEAEARIMGEQSRFAAKSMAPVLYDPAATAGDREGTSGYTLPMEPITARYRALGNLAGTCFS